MMLLIAAVLGVLWLLCLLAHLSWGVVNFVLLLAVASALSHYLLSRHRAA